MLCCNHFLIVLPDITILGALTAQISATFQSYTSISWLMTAYLLASATVQPLCGRITDIYGRRAGIMFASIFFVAGLLLCGLANSMGMLILGRAVSGVGAGVCMTTTAVMIGDLVPLRSRALWQGYNNVVFGLSLGSGAYLGGLLNEAIGWRWAFIGQIPFGVLSGVLSYFLIDLPCKETQTSKIKRVDFAGALTLCFSIVLFLVGVDSAGNTVPWTHPLVLITVPCSLVALTAFIYIELYYAVEPIIPVRLLTLRTVASCCWLNFFILAFAVPLLFYLPIWLQIVRDLSTSQTGLRTIAWATGASLGSLGAGIIVRRTGRYYWLMISNQTTKIIMAILIVMLFTADMQPWIPFVVFFFCGMSVTAGLTIALPPMIAAVSHEQQAVITSASYLFRSVGGTIGSAIAGVVFQNSFKNGLWDKFGDYPNAEQRIRAIRDNPDVIRGLGPKWRRGALQVYEDATRKVWMLMLAVAVLALLSGSIMREHKLHTTIQRR